MPIMADFTLGNRRKASRGFTLVELLVVIAIIGILASLLTPVLMKARQEGFKTDSKNNLRNIVNAAQMYADERRFYPWSRAIVPGGQQPDFIADCHLGSSGHYNPMLGPMVMFLQRLLLLLPTLVLISLWVSVELLKG